MGHRLLAPPASVIASIIRFARATPMNRLFHAPLMRRVPARAVRRPGLAVHLEPLAVVEPVLAARRNDHLVRGDLGEVVGSSIMVRNFA